MCYGTTTGTGKVRGILGCIWQENARTLNLFGHIVFLSYRFHHQYTSNNSLLIILLLSLPDLKKTNEWMNANFKFRNGKLFTLLHVWPSEIALRATMKGEDKPTTEPSSWLPFCNVYTRTKGLTVSPVYDGRTYFVSNPVLKSGVVYLILSRDE